MDDHRFAEYGEHATFARTMNRLTSPAFANERAVPKALLAAACGSFALNPGLAHGWSAGVIQGAKVESRRKEGEISRHLIPGWRECPWEVSCVWRGEVQR